MSELPEITKLQLQQSVETYRVMLSLLVQICTVLVIANATTVGYAVQQKLAAVIWVGLIFPLSLLFISRLVFRLFLPVLATAVEIETKYKDPMVSGLMSNFVAFGVSDEFLSSLRSASVLEHGEAKVSAIVSLRRPSFTGNEPMKWMLMTVIFLQMVAPPLLWYFAGWKFFGK